MIIREDLIKQRKLCLVLDIDETLVHVNQHKGDFIVVDGNPYKIVLRPYLKDTLKVLQEYYRLVFYTSASRSYAEAILSFIGIDTDYLIACGDSGTSSFLKHIDLVSDAKDLCVIVDDDRSYWPDEDIVQIKPFYGDEKDTELPHLFLTLMKRYRKLKYVFDEEP